MRRFVLSLALGASSIFALTACGQQLPLSGQQLGQESAAVLAAESADAVVKAKTTQYQNAEMPEEAKVQLQTLLNTTASSFQTQGRRSYYQEYSTPIGLYVASSDGHYWACKNSPWVWWDRKVPNCRTATR